MKHIHIALLTMAALLFGSAGHAAPLTGHDVRIRISEDGGPTVVDLNRTVLNGPIELTAADDSFFGTASSLDIGPDFVNFMSDGTGPAGTYDLRIDILTSTFEFSPLPTMTTGLGGNYQLLSEILLIDGFVWGGNAGSLLLEGLSVSASASVPAPAALALLGFGLIGLGARRRKA